MNMNIWFKLYRTVIYIYIYIAILFAFQSNSLVNRLSVKHEQAFERQKVERGDFFI